MSNLVIPVSFVAFLILSIVLFVKRNKIIAKYDVGYISSFFFAAYMLAPIFAIIGTIASTGDNSEIPVAVFMIYPLIGLGIFLWVYRGKTKEYKIGKFFAMLGIGICAAYVFIFKMLKIIHLFESDTRTAPNHQVRQTGPIPNAKSTNDIFRGRINEYGEIYDYGGKLLARINDNGDIFYPNGVYYGHRDYAGDVYDASGKYLGRIKDGEIKDANWAYTGKLNND